MRGVRLVEWPNVIGRRKCWVPHGFAVHNAPIFSGAKVFGDLFEQGKVMIMWACREFAQSDGCITNVGATGDVGIQQFTKQGAVGKTIFGDKGHMFGSAFSRAMVLVQRSHSIRGYGYGGF